MELARVLSPRDSTGTTLSTQGIGLLACRKKKQIEDASLCIVYVKFVDCYNNRQLIAISLAGNIQNYL